MKNLRIRLFSTLSAICLISINLCNNNLFIPVHATIEDDIAQAEEEVRVAQEELDGLNLVLQTGSYGFFMFHESEGATAVIELIMEYQEDPNTTMTDNMKTIWGDPKDATSLENMKKGVQIVIHGNELRASDDNFTSPANQAPLMITDTMMAIAQVRANASEGYMNHWPYLGQNGYNVGENLAWGYRNPQDGWYTEEKRVFDWALSKGYNPNNLTDHQKQQCVTELGLWGVDWVQVGHYRNIMNSYTVTGAAINGYYPTSSQEFAYSATQKGYTDVMYTPEQYLADIILYEETMDNLIAQAQVKLDNAKANLERLQAMIQNDTVVKINTTNNYAMHSDGHAIFWLANAQSVRTDILYQVYEDSALTQLSTTNQDLTWDVEMVGGFVNSDFTSEMTTLLPTSSRKTTWTAGSSSNSIAVKSAKSGIYKVTVTASGNSDYCYVVIPGDVDRNGYLRMNDAAQILNIVRNAFEVLNDEFTKPIADMDGNGYLRVNDRTIVIDKIRGN